MERVPSDEVNACVANKAQVGRTRIVSDVMDWFLDYPPREGLNLNTHSIVFQRGDIRGSIVDFGESVFSLRRI